MSVETCLHREMSRWAEMRKRSVEEELPVPERLVLQEQRAQALMAAARRKRRPQRFLDQALFSFRRACRKLNELFSTLEALDEMGDKFEKIPPQQDLIEDQRTIEALFEECFSLLCDGDLEGGRKKTELIRKKVDEIDERYTARLLVA